MAVSTTGAQLKPELRKPKLTTRQWIVIAAAVIVLAGLVAAARWVYFASEEPPIRVRNGSMNLVLDSGTWVTNGSAWSPSVGAITGKYDVKVDLAEGITCLSGTTATGNVIKITYGDSPNPIMITPAAKKTQVTPKGGFTNPTPIPRLLRYGTAGDGKYIRQIEVLGGGSSFSCSFNNAQELFEIIICPSGHPACK
jgi:hypothetical protein